MEALRFQFLPGSRFWILIRELQRDSIISVNSIGQYWSVSISIFSTCPVCRESLFPGAPGLADAPPVSASSALSAVQSLLFTAYCSCGHRSQAMGRLRRLGGVFHKKAIIYHKIALCDCRCGFIVMRCPACARAFCRSRFPGNSPGIWR